ncbi:polyprenyl synthetase family protein [Streptomyces sp. NPDC090080]|uniref:polyprenyl synthetase family protein n=1 Tax=Streptomyces sp. NPDC090080 TaxID=3365939 RepID=UPI0038108F83
MGYSPSEAHFLKAVARRMRQEIATLGPELRSLAFYVLGWPEKPDTEGFDYFEEPRQPSLTMWSTGIPDLAEESAVAAAASVELLRGASLLHAGFLETAKVVERNSSAWWLYDAGASVMCGDALMSLSSSVLHDLDEAATVRVGARLMKAFRCAIAGHLDDLLFSQRPWLGNGVVTMADYERMAANKTAELFAISASVGPLLAGMPDSDVDGFARVGHHLGLAYQAMSDIMLVKPMVEAGGFGDEAKLRIKKSLPLVWATTHEHSAARRLCALLADPARAEFDEIFSIFDEMQIFENSRRFARDQTVEAMGAARNLHITREEIAWLEEYAVLILAHP